MKNILIKLGLFLGLSPLIAFAEIGDTVDVCSDISLTTVGKIFNWGSCLLIKTVIPFLFSLATAAFIWGVIQYVVNPENEEKRKKGKTYMIWGIFALFVMVSMWGLVGILTGTFGLKILIPQLSQ
jgi:zinc transporter ZupT